MKLPLILSVPHAGASVPPEVKDLCLLTAEQIIADGDTGAREIYDLADEVEAFVTSDVARAIVDLNRAEDDRRTDGVVKTHTCWSARIYRQPLPEEIVSQLLLRHHRPYHARLSALSRSAGVKLGVDCHTMAAKGPPIGPDPGRERPAVCLGNADGTCPGDWMERLALCFREVFGENVAINHPFRGGHIVCAHAKELPWVQLELARAPFLSNADKRARVLSALTQFCERTF